MLHPGSMGAALATALAGAGHRVLWAGQGRSDATAKRAACFEDVVTVAALATQAEVILSVCPPQSAERVAEEVAAAGFRGLYADLNAISPARVERVAARLDRLVDGAIVGAPPGSGGATTVLLSGSEAAQLVALFAGTEMAAHVVGDRPGPASALKLAFSLATKGVQAVYAISAALAAQWGLEAQYHSLFDDQHANDPEPAYRRMPAVASRAWRFLAEMEEAADTCRESGLPAGAAESAARVYSSWERHRDLDGIPPEQLYRELRAP